jgi:hypothetical protein
VPTSLENALINRRLRRDLQNALRAKASGRGGVEFCLLRIVVDAPDDDDILYPAGDEQFAGLIEVAGVRDPQPVRAVIVPGQDP